MTSPCTTAVDSAIKHLKSLYPNDSWLATYSSAHKWRITDDVKRVGQLAECFDQCKVLDIGAVPFLTSTALARCNCDVTAIDIFPERYGKVVERASINVVKHDIERVPLPFRDESFQIVVLAEVFEHLRINPVFTLREIKRVLVEGGRLYLTTPNVLSLSGWLNILRNQQIGAVGGDPYEEFKKLQTRGHMGHVREYTRHEVEAVLSKTGFNVDRVDYRGSYPGIAELVVRVFPFLRPYLSVVGSRD